jgi:hypothetical protein
MLATITKNIIAQQAEDTDYTMTVEEEEEIKTK